MPRALHYAFLALALFAAFHVVIVNKLTAQQYEIQRTASQEQLFALPSPIVRILALDYKGIVSDYLFIKGIVYIGGFVSGPSRGRFQLTETQWQAFYRTMDVSTDLDPYFLDPYYLANAFLTWDAGMVRETNTLLDKGTRSRDWDWLLPFFAGFNYFYFLQENDKASEMLMEASRRQDNNPVLASLASKLAFKANKTENSIAFLEELLSKTDDIVMKRRYAIRIYAFKGILALEKAVTEYRHKFRRAPKDIDELVAKKFIAELPKDPYGGKYYIDADGNVRTTSEDQLLPYMRKK